MTESTGGNGKPTGGDMSTRDTVGGEYRDYMFPDEAGIFDNPQSGGGTSFIDWLKNNSVVKIKNGTIYESKLDYAHSGVGVPKRFSVGVQEYDGKCYIGISLWINAK